MSYYYEHKFTSPEGVYAIVKEELKSYFDTGAVDDLMFPTYLNKCLEKLGKTSYTIAQEMLFIDNYQSRLPDNFYAMKEAWACSEVEMRPYQTANSFYSQTASTTIQIAPMTITGDPTCQDTLYDEDGECQPEILQAVYKTNHEFPRSFRREYMLKPGNISVKKNCNLTYDGDWEVYAATVPVGSTSMYSSTYDSFDIRGNKFVTNFRTGNVNIIFYATDYDDLGNQMIPDNYRVKEYIELFIKYKVFETLTNQTNDETFNQINQKMINYKQASDEAYILAETEVRKHTVYQKQRRIIKQKRSLNKYELPNRTNRYYWRR